MTAVVPQIRHFTMGPSTTWRTDVTRSSPPLSALRRILVILALSLALPMPVAAAPPPNDVHPGIAIESLPFSHTTTTVEAEIHAMEMSPTCVVGSTNSVWYTFAPATGVNVVADTFGSNYDTVIDVRRGTLTDDFFDPGFEDLADVGCNDNAGGGLQSQLAFTAEAGQNYLIRVSSYEADGGSLSFRLVGTLPNVAMARPAEVGVRGLAVIGLMLIGVAMLGIARPFRRQRAQGAR